MPGPFKSPVHTWILFIAVWDQVVEPSLGVYTLILRDQTGRVGLAWASQRRVGESLQGDRL